MSIDNLLLKYGEPLSCVSSQGEIKFKCPVCGHNSFSVNIIDGRVFCFKCEYGRGLNIGKQTIFSRVEVNLSVQEEIIKRIHSSASLSEFHKLYLKNRGIHNPGKFGIVTIPMDIHQEIKDFSEEDLIDSGLFTRAKFGIKRKMFLSFGRILIPHWSGEKIIGWKSRKSPIDPETFFTYAKPLGSKDSKKIWYKEVGEDFVITEGELKAIASCEAGVPAGCISGISSWMSVQDCIPWKVKRFFIVLDTEASMESGHPVIDSAVKIAEIIGERASIAFLPGSGTKVDIDSFLTKNSPEEYRLHLEHCWWKRKKQRKKWELLEGRWKNHLFCTE